MDRVADLGMELDPVDAALGVLEGRDRASSASTPMTRNPGGGATTESPWLIQTVCSASSPAKSAESAASRAVARPYSRSLAAATSPPRACAIHCIP